MLRRGDVVSILYEFRQPGDNLFIWTALTNEFKGELDICPIKPDSSLDGIRTVKTHMVEYKNINLIYDHIEPEGPQLDFLPQ